MDSVPPASRFLSTLSLRRATRLFLEIYTLFKNFYPRSPCGERRVVHVAQDPSPGRISIHALLAESDINRNIANGQSQISIHALLAESDLSLALHKRGCIIFLSTLSLRRATPRKNLVNGIRLIFLSTLSLRRATFSLLCRILFRRYFYPRSPCGERPP